jgi:streptogramin lyase
MKSKVASFMTLIIGLSTASILQDVWGASATITEYNIPTKDSALRSIAVDSSGRVWFTEFNGKKIGRFDPTTGMFKEYRVHFAPWCVIYNVLDKLIYFTAGDYSNGHYGVLNPTNGAISEFPTSLPVASSVDCTITPDRYFWFNGWDSQTVSKSDNSGHIINYIPPYFGYTSGLTEDPEGNLWLTIVGAYEYNPTLLKLDTKLAQPGTSTGFETIPLPTNQETVRSPLAALGKIWFPMMNSSKIASYDPTAKVFETFSTPTPNATPGRLAVDRWGRLWFAENSVNQIGMLDLRTHTISEFPVPTPNSHPEQITVDNNQDVVWFTEASGNKIGKLILR